MSTKLLPLVAVLVCFTCQVSASTTTTMMTTTAQNTTTNVTSASTTTNASASTGMMTTTMATSSSTVMGASTPRTSIATTDGNETTSNGTTSSPTNDTTEMITTEADTTMAETTTKAMPTTTAAAPDYMEHQLDTALFFLELTVGPTNKSDIQYRDMNMTEMDLLLLEKLRVIFGAVSSGVRLQRLTEEFEYTLVLEFLVSRIDNKTKENIEAALRTLTPPDFTVPDINTTLARVDKFISGTSDICQATNVCPLGFRCNEMGCEHMCKMENCSMHGTCVVRVLANMSADTMCNCDITYDTEYEGKHCENSRRGKEQIIAIVAGVLGAACALLLLILIIIIIVYITSKRKQRNIVLQSDEYFNSTYHNTPIGTENHGMKKMNGVDDDY